MYVEYKLGNNNLNYCREYSYFFSYPEVQFTCKSKTIILALKEFERIRLHAGFDTLLTTFLFNIFRGQFS